MSLPQLKTYTEEDYYNLPENVRIELIDGQFYDMAVPNKVHQEILMELSALIHNHIKSKNGSCRVYPAPFAVRLLNDEHTIVEPDISVVCDSDKLTDKGCNGAPDWIIEIVSPSNPSHDYITKLSLFATKTYSFDHTVKAGIFDDLFIDFSSLDFNI